MKHEAAQLAHQTHQGTLAGLDPTHPSVEDSMEAIWEAYCIWHRDYWGVKGSYVKGSWSAYQAGVTLGLEAQTAPAPAPAPAIDEQIWAKFVLYYESLGRGSPEKEDLDNPLMDVQEHYNLFKAEYHAKREALRDEFAGQAMQGLLPRYPVGMAIDHAEVAMRAYNMAREMMRIRDKQASFSRNI